MQNQRIDKKLETRSKIVDSAGRGFRRYGYGGLGVDGLAKDAGVTSGAFYAHFATKADAFRAAVVAGMGELRAGIEKLRSERPDWRRALIDLYLTDRRTGPIEQSCALQNLASEVARSDLTTRAAFETELKAVLAAAADDEQPAHDPIALLALLVGGVSIARAVADPELSNAIAAAVRRGAERLTADPSAKDNR